MFDHQQPSLDIREQMQHELLTWFQNTARDLPWRWTRDPYHILVSEIMLQQTQVDRVLPHYVAFIQAFPTLHALANASPAEVIQQWAGLGYNRRAINVQRTARLVLSEHRGVFPNDVATLKKLPGIGDYTAGAIACFAFGQDVAFLDTNMRRVIYRSLVGAEQQGQEKSERTLLEMAREMIPPGQGWQWNQAIMELGALICSATNPTCSCCPIRDHCRAYAWGKSEQSSQICHQEQGSTQTTIYEYKPRSQRRVAERRASFVGTNRYYRGRLIDALRHIQPGETLSIAQVGLQIKEDYHPKDSDWLQTLVEGLARDGLVEIIDQAVRLPIT